MDDIRLRHVGHCFCQITASDAARAGRTARLARLAWNARRPPSACLGLGTITTPKRRADLHPSRRSAASADINTFVMERERIDNAGTRAGAARASWPDVFRLVTPDPLAWEDVPGPWVAPAVSRAITTGEERR
jgi:hypothetical protein